MLRANRSRSSSSLFGSTTSQSDSDSLSELQGVFKTLQLSSQDILFDEEGNLYAATLSKLIEQMTESIGKCVFT